MSIKDVLEVLNEQMIYSDRERYYPPWYHQYSDHDDPWIDGSRDLLRSFGRFRSKSDNAPVGPWQHYDNYISATDKKMHMQCGPSNMFLVDLLRAYFSDTPQIQVKLVTVASYDQFGRVRIYRHALTELYDVVSGETLYLDATPSKMTADLAKKSMGRMPQILRDFEQDTVARANDMTRLMSAKGADDSEINRPLQLSRVALDVTTGFDSVRVFAGQVKESWARVQAAREAFSDLLSKRGFVESPRSLTPVVREFLRACESAFTASDWSDLRSMLKKMDVLDESGGGMRDAYFVALKKILRSLEFFRAQALREVRPSAEELLYLDDQHYEALKAEFMLLGRAPEALWLTESFGVLSPDCEELSTSGQRSAEPVTF